MKFWMKRNRNQGIKKSARYEIKVEGILNKSWLSWFDGMLIIHGDGITTLICEAIDQAALRGILCKIWDLNLFIIAVNQIENNNTFL